MARCVLGLVSVSEGRRGQLCAAVCRCFTASWGKGCAVALVIAPRSRSGTVSLLGVFSVPQGLLDVRGMLCAYRGPAQPKAARPAGHPTLRAPQSPALQPQRSTPVAAGADRAGCCGVGAARLPAPHSTACGRTPIVRPHRTGTAAQGAAPRPL